jgi:DNA-binding NarL/FixJ family response regulator
MTICLDCSLKKVVESDTTLRCIGVWTTAEDALKKIDAFRPHIVLMDINLPGMSGIEATARLKQYLPDIKVVMVTVYRDHDKIFAALKAGACGYLLKRSNPSEVREAIHDVRSGGAPMSPEIARRVVEAAGKYYGTALLAWLEYLATADQAQEALARAEKAEAELAALIKDMGVPE